MFWTVAQEVPQFSLNKWLFDNLFEILMMLVGGIYFIVQYRRLTDDTRKEVRSLKDRLDRREKALPDTLEGQVEVIADKLEVHMASSSPHPSCPVHNANIESLKQEVRQGFEDLRTGQKEVREQIAKMDDRIYDLIINGKKVHKATEM